MSSDKKIEVKIVANADSFTQTMKTVERDVQKLKKKKQLESGKERKEGEKKERDQGRVSSRSLNAQSKAYDKASASVKKYALEVEKLNKALISQARIVGATKGVPGFAGTRGSGSGSSGGGGAGVGSYSSGGGGKRPWYSASVGGVARGLGTAGMAAGGALLGLMGSQIQQGHGAYVNYRLAQARLSGMDTTMGGVDSARRRAEALGYSGNETAEMMATIGRQTGRTQDVTTAQAITRMSGVEFGEAAGLMGTMSRGGINLQDPKGKKELERIFSSATAAGLDKSRFGEQVVGIAGLLERQGGATAGDLSATGVSALAAMLGASGKSGLQGARGMAVMDSLDQMIRGPGGGEAGKVLALQAMGWGKPGGTSSLYDAEKRLERGLTGEGGVQNLMDLFAETERQHGGGERQIMALQQLSGGKLTKDQLEAVREVIKEGGPDLEKRIAEISKDNSIEAQSLAAMKGIGAEAKEQARLQNRLIDMGKETYDSIRSMQDSLNKVVLSFFPLAVKLLEKIATGLELIAQMVEHVANFFGYNKTEAYEDAENARQDAANVMSDPNMSTQDKIKALESMSQASAVAHARSDMASEQLGTGVWDTISNMWRNKDTEGAGRTSSQGLRGYSGPTVTAAPTIIDDQIATLRAQAEKEESNIAAIVAREQTKMYKGETQANSELTQMVSSLRDELSRDGSLDSDDLAKLSALIEQYVRANIQTLIMVGNQGSTPAKPVVVTPD